MRCAGTLRWTTSTVGIGTVWGLNRRRQKQAPFTFFRKGRGLFRIFTRLVSTAIFFRASTAPF